MKRLTLTDCTARGDGPIFAEVLPGFLLERGGISQYQAGERTHPEGRHVHDVPEVFCILQGSGEVEIDGSPSPFETGDVLVIEVGEDHHLISRGEQPLVLAWMHLRSATGT